MSSKGQDTVDSWEEIDEDRLASRLSKLSSDDTVRSGELLTPNVASGNGKAGSSANSLSGMLDEELRPRMILQRPQMQILKRPQSIVQEENVTIDSKPKTNIKSLDQRKQEYAKARLRILGSAHDEEEQQQKQPVELSKKSNTNVNGLRINNNSSGNSNVGGTVRPDRPQSSFRPVPGNFHMPLHPGAYYQPHSAVTRCQLPPEPPSNHHYYQHQGPPPQPGGYAFPHHHQQLQQQAHQHQKQLMSFVGMSPQSSGPASSYHQQMAGYNALGGISSNNNVLRMPAGPDGSHGFTMRR
ncbi:SUZ domain-containing protein 1 [Wyeomyia smithii]|uniref:SUZ domain-containing protein 1 n=1 Tax=Wyeomyia smithii TaxID=174621 RepID=UPI002467AF0A|nr:SUZ domain-containing protein 1 [Wyeomyia smithii]